MRIQLPHKKKAIKMRKMKEVNKNIMVMRSYMTLEKKRKNIHKKINIQNNTNNKNNQRQGTCQRN